MDEIMIQIERYKAELEIISQMADRIGKTMTGLSRNGRVPDMAEIFSGKKPEKEFYTTEELGEALHVSREKIRWLRKAGLLQGARLGHGFIYDVMNVRKFFDECAGFDLSSKEKIEAAAAVIKKERIEKRRSARKRL